MLEKIIEKFPLSLKKIVLKVGYLKNGNRLKNYEQFGNYHIYHINGIYVPSASLGWFVTLDTIREYCFKCSFFYYKPKVGDVIIDIGSGLGEETLLASTMVGKNGIRN